MSQAVFHLADDSDGLRVVKLTLLVAHLLAFQDLLDDLVDVVRVATVHSDIERFFVLLHFEQEGNLFDDVTFIVNQEA